MEEQHLQRYFTGPPISPGLPAPQNTRLNGYPLCYPYQNVYFGRVLVTLLTCTHIPLVLCRTIWNIAPAICSLIYTVTHNDPIRSHAQLHARAQLHVRSTCYC